MLSKSDHFLECCVTGTLSANSPDITSAVHEANLSPFHKLTKQQTAVMERLAAGLSNKAIADELQLSRSTVKTHIWGIYQKTHFRNRIELAVSWLIFTGALVRTERIWISGARK